MLRLRASASSTRLRSLSDLEKSDKEYDLYTDPVQVCVVFNMVETIIHIALS